MCGWIIRSTVHCCFFQKGSFLEIFFLYKQCSKLRTQRNFAHILDSVMGRAVSNMVFVINVEIHAYS